MRLPAASALACLAILVAGPAVAQDERPTGYPRSANEGRNGPVAVSAVYTAEVRSVASGGLRRGTRYLDDLDLQVAVDAEGLVGWMGARFFAFAIRNDGARFSPALSGDFQRVSNIETDVRAIRLFEAWGEQDVGADASVKFGLYNLNSEFDTTDAGGLFLLSSHGIGPDLGQSGRNGPSIFPVTSLAVRGEWAPTKHVLLRVAVLDGVPGDPARPKATVIRLRRGDGALLIAEADRLSDRTKWAVGGWGYTARFVPVVETGPQASSRGDKGAYAFVERQLAGGLRGGAGLAGWMRIGVADPRYNPVARYVGGGLVRTATFRGRDDDQVGASLGWAAFGRPYRDRQRVGRGELVVEASYRFSIAEWLSVQPDLQLVFAPGGRRDLGTAVIPALRVKLGR